MSPNPNGDQLVSVAVPRPVEGLFTYRVSAQLAQQIRVGGWVRVPFGRTKLHAFVEEDPRPMSEMPLGLDDSKLKDVIEVGDPEAIIPPDVRALCKWAHDYYRSPIGEIYSVAAPAAGLGLKTAKREARALKQRKIIAAPRVELTSDQAQAIEKIEALRVGSASSSTRAMPLNAVRVALLRGVTGSGKTEVYLELARRTLSEGKGVILLVPEIALTPQLHERFESGLGTAVGLWHSALPAGQRRDQLSALRSRELRVLIGARSAIFAPVPDLGLIIIDEEHDQTYKQEERVRYHARDLAVVRSKISGATVVLGSATPSLESLERVREGKYIEAVLPQRIGAGGMPAIELINLADEIWVDGTQAILAEKTLASIQSAIAAGEQVMVFLNRRGFASFLICQDCGDVPGCPHCSVSLTLHKRRGLLRCHLCGHQEPTPDHCRKCMSDRLAPMGAGTESLEDDLQRLVAGAKTLRLDRDQVTSATRLGAVLEEFRSGKANILLGTQMLVKGHDFPGVTQVIVILADALFRFPDFRAPERAYQILTQVAGRAGRGEQTGKVLIQTFNPDHAVLKAVTGQISESEFLESERSLRQALGYSPFGRLARIRFEHEDAATAESRARATAKYLERPDAGTADGLEVLGPSQAFLERVKGIYRWDLMVKSREIGPLSRKVFAAQDFCASRKWPCLVDIDPYGVN